MFHLFRTIFGAYEFADTSKATSDSWVEVVFDCIVGSELYYSYLPGKASAMTVHLLP